MKYGLQIYFVLKLQEKHQYRVYQYKMLAHMHTIRRMLAKFYNYNYYCY